MVCWNHYANYRYAYVDGSVLLSSTIDGVTRFRPPIGPRNKALMAELYHLAHKVSGLRPIVLMDTATAMWVKDALGPAEIIQDIDQAEYVYRTSDLADLPNGMYHSTRRQLSRFKRNYAYTVEPYSPEKGEEAREFLLDWCEWKQNLDDPILTNEKDALLYAIDHFAELELSGLLIRVDGRIGAMSIFEPLNADTALVHFEKGRPDCEGIYKAINQETAAALKGRFEFINRESDLGIPGLREAKQRYHPHHMVDVYSMKGVSCCESLCACEYFSCLREASSMVSRCLSKPI